MNNHEYLDCILDDALNEYREAEPLAGLEDRVMQRLRLQPVQRLTVWWKWGAIAACAALALVALWIGMGSNRLLNSPQDQAATLEQTAQVPVTKPAGGEANVSEQRPPEQIAARRPQTPVQASKAANNALDELTSRMIQPRASGPEATQFPSPTPLTPEEHALLALVRSNPDALLSQINQSQELEIAPIAIKPLAGSEAPAQENSNE